MIEIKSQFIDRSAVLLSIKNLTNAQDALTDLAINEGSTDKLLFAQRELIEIISTMLDQLEDYEENEARNGKRE